MRDARRVILTALVGAAFLLLIDNFASGYHKYLIELMGIYAILTVSLGLTNGFTDVFSLGHVGFMAVGAYTAALLTFPLEKRPSYFPELPSMLKGAYLPYPAALLVGGLLAAAIAFVIGFPVLRLRGHYLAVATLGFMAVVYSLLLNLEPITRGALGISGIPEYTNIWWIYLWLGITVYVTWRIVDSYHGRAMIAIREDSIAAQSLGIDTFRYRLMAFVIGAFFAGVAGGLYAHLITLIDPRAFSFVLTFNVIIMLIVGGMYTISGAWLGAVLFTVLMQVLKPVEESTGLYGLVELIFSALLVVIMIYKPRGLLEEELPTLVRRWLKAGEESKPS